MYLNGDFDKILYNSNILIKHLLADSDIAYVPYYRSYCILKVSKYQVKPLNSNSSINIVSNIHNFLIAKIENSIYLNLSNHMYSRIVSNNSTSYKLTKIY